MELEYQERWHIPCLFLELGCPRLAQYHPPPESWR
jgi:hypothetical protein